MSDLKPCPACGEKKALYLGRLDQVQCCGDCCMIGPKDDPDGAKWNALPRREDADAELGELRAVKRAWERNRESAQHHLVHGLLRPEELDRILAEELAKGGE